MIRRGGYGAISIAMSLSHVQCASSAHPSPEPECKIFYVESCDGSNADVVVNAEYEMDQTGYGRLTRIVSVTPDNPAVRDKVLKRVPQGVRFGSASPPGAVIKTFQFCERTPVKIIAAGQCPSEDELAKQATAEGYAVTGVEKK